MTNPLRLPVGLTQLEDGVGRSWHPIGSQGRPRVRRGWLGEQSQWDQRRMDWRRTGVEPASTGVHGHPGNREVPFTFCGRGRQIKKVSSCNFSFERSHWLFRMEAAETSSPCDEVPTSLQKFPFIKIKKRVSMVVLLSQHSCMCVDGCPFCSGLMRHRLARHIHSPILCKKG